MLELMWCRYRESRCDAFADNAFLVFFDWPVVIVHEQATESASSRRISGSKAKRHYQMDPQTWITRYKIAFRTIFNSERQVRGLAPRERRPIALKLRQLTLDLRSTHKTKKRIAQFPGKRKLGLRIDDNRNIPSL